MSTETSQPTNRNSRDDRNQPKNKRKGKTAEKQKKGKIGPRFPPESPGYLCYNGIKIYPAVLSMLHHLARQDQAICNLNVHDRWGIHISQAPHISVLPRLTARNSFLAVIDANSKLKTVQDVWQDCILKFLQNGHPVRRIEVYLPVVQRLRMLRSDACQCW